MNNKQSINENSNISQRNFVNWFNTKGSARKDIVNQYLSSAVVPNENESKTEAKTRIIQNNTWLSNLDERMKNASKVTSQFVQAEFNRATKRSWFTQ